MDWQCLRVLHYPDAPLKVRREFGSAQHGEIQCHQEYHLVHRPPHLSDLWDHLHLHHRHYGHGEVAERDQRSGQEALSFRAPFYNVEHLLGWWESPVDVTDQRCHRTPYYSVPPLRGRREYCSAEQGELVGLGEIQCHRDDRLARRRPQLSHHQVCVYLCF